MLIEEGVAKDAENEAQGHQAEAPTYAREAEAQPEWRFVVIICTSFINPVHHVAQVPPILHHP